MHQREKFAYAENNDLRVQIVHVSYKSEDKDTEFVFTVILPNRGVQLDVVEQKLASQPNLMQIKDRLYISKVIHKAFIDVNEE
ncbi:unnamed protein product, partial [Rotaria sordida]